MIEKILKITGMHHGLQVVAIILATHWFGLGIYAAVFGGAYFFGREVSQSQYRKWTSNPIIIAQNIEWMDFVTPCLIAAGYIIWRTI